MGQCHLGMEPNERDGMSVIALCIPAICRGVNGDAFCNCRRSASARMSCMATTECRDARRSTQWTVGELSLNNATCAPFSDGHTSSITSHSRSSPAISRSEFVIDPAGFASDMISRLMSSGHSSRKTVGGTPFRSPMTMPPTPCFDASLIPT